MRFALKAHNLEKKLAYFDNFPYDVTRKDLVRAAQAFLRILKKEAHMEYISAELKQILDCVAQPAFLVHNRVIRYANANALRLPVVPDRPISSLDDFDASRYAAFDGSGALVLPMTLGGKPHQALIRRIRHGDLFLLEPERDDNAARLDAFAAAAQTLRLPVSNLFATASHLFPYLEESEDPEIQKHVAIINKYCYQLLRSIGNMSDAQKLCSGDVIMHFAQIELYDFFRSVAEKADTMCAAAGICFSCDCPPGSFFGRIDRARMERALLNLLSNALKHTPTGGTIRMAFERGSAFSTISVINSGEVMDPAALGSAFSRYADPAGFDPRDGIGLGLPIARWIAGLHGGTVLLRSLPDGGTCAVISFETGSSESVLRTPTVRYGGFDPFLVELSDALPTAVYDSENVN